MTRTAITVLTLVISLLVGLLYLLRPQTRSAPRYHDYCVIGAGPAGLQMGYFFHRAGRDYVVFERSNTSGDFFLTYPRHRKMLSINKRYTGRTNKEFNLRHDWNSLLSHDESLLFKHYSEDLLPQADDMVTYLRDFTRRLGIRVLYNTDIRNIHSIKSTAPRHQHQYMMEDQHGNMYSCKVLIVATGMWKPYIPNLIGVHLAVGYENVSTDPADFEGKTVLILGRGNSGNEVAKTIYGVTTHVHMVGRSRARLAWATHYADDLRAVNNEVLDTYQLKSLDGMVETTFMKEGRPRRIFPVDDKIKIGTEREDKENDRHNTLLMGDDLQTRTEYDVVVRCTGFEFDFSLFRNDLKELVVAHGDWEEFVTRYPSIQHNYEVPDSPGLFVAGAASHSLDYRKSAGGSIHGFRYTARALWRLLEWRYEGVRWPCQRIRTTDLLNHLLKRINEVSGLYQMMYVLADVVLLSEDKQWVEYCEEIPTSLVSSMEEHVGLRGDRVLLLCMAMGRGYSGPGNDVFGADRPVTDPAEANRSTAVHPVLYYYSNITRTINTSEELEDYLTDDDARTYIRNTRRLPAPTAVHHVLEDLYTKWDQPRSHIIPLRHFLQDIMQLDLRMRFAQFCFQEVLLYQEPSPYCRDRYLNGPAMTAVL